MKTVNLNWDLWNKYLKQWLDFTRHSHSRHPFLGSIVYVYFCEETNPSIAHTLLVSEAFVELKFFGACLPDKTHNERENDLFHSILKRASGMNSDAMHLKP